MITPEQVSCYQMFGFLLLKRLYSSDEMAAISHEFDDLTSRDRQGQPFPGLKRQSLYGIAELSPLLTRLTVDDDRIYQTVEQLMGPGFVWLNSEGNLYVGDTGWHSDDSRLSYPPMKVSLYLDPLTKDTGCMRLIPGSHRPPFHHDLQAMARLGVPGADVPAYPCESQPGDVLFMNMNTWHAAFGGAPGRRHLAVNFAPAPQTSEHIDLLEQNYNGLLSLIQRLQYSQPDRVATDAFLHSDRPHLQSITAKWIELGFK